MSQSLSPVFDLVAHYEQLNYFVALDLLNPTIVGLIDAVKTELGPFHPEIINMKSFRFQYVDGKDQDTDKIVITSDQSLERAIGSCWRSGKLKLKIFVSEISLDKKDCTKQEQREQQQTEQQQQRKYEREKWKDLSDPDHPNHSSVSERD